MEQTKRRGRRSEADKYECLPGYTEKQSKVIRGEVDYATVNGRLAYQLLKSATRLNDQSVVELAHQLLDDAHERTRQNNNARTKKRKHNLKHGTIVWKQPKSHEYTEHQQRVIRGEISVEDVHTNELISIYGKAKDQGDIELSERILSIIIDRRTEYVEREQAKKMYRLQVLKSGGGDTNDPDVYMRRDSLVPWEQNVLRSVVDLNDCTTEHLIHILDVCEHKNDEHGIMMSKLLLEIKEHPETVYVTQDPKVAVDMIEQMVGKPIRRPETWFLK